MEANTYLRSAYQVAIIPTDLHHEATIIKAAQSLDCLHKTINSIFERIDARLERNGAKVQDINRRVKRAQGKIDALVGSKRAIKIFAPARFPAGEVFANIASTFPQVAGQLMEGNHENPDCRQQEMASVADEDPTSFHVRAEQEHEAPLVAERKLTNRTSGLGGLPLNGVRSVPSLMRFNTNEFAYGDDLNAWKRSLPPQRTRRAASQNKITTENLLAPAPHSLAHGTTKLATPAGDLRYNPAALAAPAIDVPLDLPDLPGIANDLQYEPVEEKTPIAPSQQFGELPDLPGLEVVEQEITVQALAAQTHIPAPVKKTLKGSIGSDPVSCTPPPPPPPPPPLPPTPQPPKTESPQPTFSTQGPIKPLSPSRETPLIMPPPPPRQADPRSELMAAIRNAGGALGGRLHSAAAAPLDVVDTTRPKAGTPATGDLMADLHNKLLLRRKGISGSQNPGDPTAGNPLMQQLSKVIPQRKSPQSSDGENSEEDVDAWT